MSFWRWLQRRPAAAIAILLPFTVLLLTAAYIHNNGGVFYFAEGRPSRVALTFDTLYSSRGLTEVLGILEREGVSATFFVCKDWLERNPEAAREILLKGHELGNCPSSSISLLYLDEKSLLAEITDFNRLAREQLEYRPRLLRPPRGDYSGLVQQAARREGCALVLWSGASYDWLSEDSPALARRVLQKARGGAILSFRVGAPPLAGALPEIITSLREQGYEPVTVSRLLAAP